MSSTFRSEEHTSELQSHVNIVCRLLLEKKNVDGVILREFQQAIHVLGVGGEGLGDVGRADAAVVHPCLAERLPGAASHTVQHAVLASLRGIPVGKPGEGSTGADYVHGAAEGGVIHVPGAPDGGPPTNDFFF